MHAWWPFLLCELNNAERDVVDYDVIIRTETFLHDVTRFVLPLLHLNSQDLQESTRNVAVKVRSRKDEMRDTLSRSNAASALLDLSASHLDQLQRYYALDQDLFGYSFEGGQCGIETGGSGTCC